MNNYNLNEERNNVFPFIILSFSLLKVWESLRKNIFFCLVGGFDYEALLYS